MSSRELIDAQFNRAVEIVQNLPKTGSIQTGYDEKLTMYRFVAILSTIPSPSSQLIYALVSTSRVSPPSQDISTHLPLLVSATAGNVAAPRPGIWDMLGRAKWWISPLILRA
jgi:acyl-CoA-binding protein